MADSFQDNLRRFVAHRLGIGESTIADTWVVASGESELDLESGELRPVDTRVFCSYVVGMKEVRKVSSFDLKYRELVMSLVAFAEASPGKEKL